MLTADRLRAITAAPDTVSDETLQFILDSVKELICNYCRLAAVPDGLTMTAYRMAADLYRAEGYGSVSGSGAVQSVKTGDTTVSYRDRSSGEAYRTYAASVLRNYETQLNRFRKLGWPSCCR